MNKKELLEEGLLLCLRVKGEEGENENDSFSLGSLEDLMSELLELQGSDNWSLLPAREEDLLNWELAE